jgi:5S rRNA maturation endonuclease (ribonuclease M5)
MSLDETLFPYLGAAERGGGDNLKFRCPFHAGGAESSASFYTHSRTGVSFCHACNQGWSLPVLLGLLGADWRIISASSELLEDAPRKKKKRDLYAPVDPGALLPEALTAITLQCPQELLAAGFPMDILQDNEVGYDSHNECPLYHLRDHLGRLVGVSGRWTEGYYVYGREQLLAFADYSYVSGYRPPQKSQFLWNLHRIYPRMFHTDDETPLVITEGFKAAMWCQVAGKSNVVALMGSYMSDSQQLLIERVTRSVVVFLDDDDAGHKGTDRICRVLPKSCVVRCVRYPTHNRRKLQPDDMPPAQVAELINNAPYHYQR